MLLTTRHGGDTTARCQLLTLFVAICLNGINCFQRFSEQPKYTEVNPGQDALLTCKVIDKRGTCSWQKDNKPVGIYAKKYEWAARPSSGSGGLHLDLLPPPAQIGGDCSLWIRSATLDFDDGLWECQVTASDFTTQDALTSQPVRLVVRVAPQRPRLEYEGVHVPPGHNITADSGTSATVKCVSHYGNPPATLSWYLGDQEIPALHAQVNSTEPDNSRTWSATSVVQVPAMRERHGDMLRCLAFHESYSAKSVPVEARLDIKYAPSIRLIGSPEIDLEEDKDALILRCVADANPPASIVWRRAGRSEISSLQETLQLRPVGRRDAGLYTCQAQNSVGTSEQLSVQLDVKYPPKILSAGPDRLTTAPLFSPAAFECVAEGNPAPNYKWVQRISHGSKYVERGSEARLVIDNVTYDYQGEYECRATSYINGQERVAISEPISLQVVGAPQVLRLHPSMHTVSVKRGDPASMSLVVCADPRPLRVAWEWGSLRLEAGSGIDRFRADDVSQDSREDCYLSTLHIQRTDEHDSRPYYLVVENERGTDRHAIHLSVEEPLEMSYLLGIAGGCLAAILILICLCIYAVRSKKCCFKGASGYKSSDKDSEKADLKSRSDSTSGPQGDSIYTTPAGFQHQHQHQHHAHHQHPGHGSPEAMKSMAASPFSAAMRDQPTQQQQQQQQQQYQLLMRQSDPLDALYRNASSITTLKKRASGGDLFNTQQRHQRDLFSGDLGIPEISSHVGSVVHTFETMAAMRRQAEQQQQQQHEEQQQQYLNIITTEAAARRLSIEQKQQQPQTSHSLLMSTCGASNKKYNQLKRKSFESRRKLLQLSKQQLLKLSSKAHVNKANPQNSCSTQTTRGEPNAALYDSSRRSFRWSPLRSRKPVAAVESFASKHYPNIEDDYRKNLFGSVKLPRQPSDQQPALNNGTRKSSYCCVEKNKSTEDANVAIVNAAFDEIFAGYSCADDDDEEIEADVNEVIIQNTNERGEQPATVGLNNRLSHINKPANKLSRAYKKLPAPPPPQTPQAAALTEVTMMQWKQRPTNVLSNLLERLKSAVPLTKHAALYRIPSDSQLHTANREHGNTTKWQGEPKPWNTSQLNLLEYPDSTKAEPRQGQKPDDEYLLRGTTLSQSFVRQPKINHYDPRPLKRSPKKTPAPPAPAAQEKHRTLEGTEMQRPFLPKNLNATLQNHSLLNNLAQQSQRYLSQKDILEEIGIIALHNNSKKIHNNDDGSRANKVSSRKLIRVYDSAEI